MIQEAGYDDLQGLLELYTQLHDNPLPEDSEQVLALWRQIIDDKNHHVVIAKENEKVISSCIIVIVLNLTHGQRPYALIENVITDALHRSRGLASACLDYAKQIAIRNGCYKIMLLTGAKEKNTLHFYEHCGYNRNDKTAFIQWLNP